MIEVDIEFPEAELKGKAVAFTEESFYKFLDETLRNPEDAADGLLARVMLEPGFEEIERVKRGFPQLARGVADLLTEDAGYTRESAALEDPLTSETPRGVLARAGLPADDAARLIREAGEMGKRLNLVTVRTKERATLWACVLATPEDAPLVQLRETRAKRKGYGKAARAASLASIVWASMKPEETFSRYPAIPALILAPTIAEMGDRSADARFRRR